MVVNLLILTLFIGVSGALRLAILNDVHLNLTEDPTQLSNNYGYDSRLKLF